MPRSVGGVLAAPMATVIGEGLKPLTTSHTPSDNSQAATGSAASAATEEYWPMPPNRAAMTAAMSRGAPMSPSAWPCRHLAP